MSTPKYPNIAVTLTGENGNVFNLTAIVRAALKRHGVPVEEIKAFSDAVMASKSYDDALQVMMQTVDVS